MEAFLCILTVWIGNHYHIENVCDRDAKLFYAQARKIPALEEHPPQTRGTKSNFNAEINESLVPGAAMSKNTSAVRRNRPV